MGSQNDSKSQVEKLVFLTIFGRAQETLDDIQESLSILALLNSALLDWLEESILAVKEKCKVFNNIWELQLISINYSQLKKNKSGRNVKILDTQLACSSSPRPPWSTYLARLCLFLLGCLLALSSSYFLCNLDSFPSAPFLHLFK